MKRVVDPHDFTSEVLKSEVIPFLHEVSGDKYLYAFEPIVIDDEAKTLTYQVLCLEGTEAYTSVSPGGFGLALLPNGEALSATFIRRFESLPEILQEVKPDAEVARVQPKKRTSRRVGKTQKPSQEA